MNATRVGAVMVYSAKYLRSQGVSILHTATGRPGARSRCACVFTIHAWFHAPMLVSQDYCCNIYTWLARLAHHSILISDR